MQATTLRLILQNRWRWGGEGGGGVAGLNIRPRTSHVDVLKGCLQSRATESAISETQTAQTIRPVLDPGAEVRLRLTLKGGKNPVAGIGPCWTKDKFSQHSVSGIYYSAHCILPQPYYLHNYIYTGWTPFTVYIYLSNIYIYLNVQYRCFCSIGITLDIKMSLLVYGAFFPKRCS